MSSSSTEGANGRKPSRYLILRFSFFCISGFRASPRMLRPAQRARAKFHAALKPADDVSFGELCGDIGSELLEVVVVARFRIVLLQRTPNFVVGEFRPEIGATGGIAAGR